MHRSLLLLALALSPLTASAQTQVAAADQSPWKQLTIEELLDVDVTAAARRPDSIRHSAAAVQVLTRETLHGAGIRYLAEAVSPTCGMADTRGAMVRIASTRSTDTATPR